MSFGKMFICKSIRNEIELCQVIFCPKKLIPIARSWKVRLPWNYIQVRSLIFTPELGFVVNWLEFIFGMSFSFFLHILSLSCWILNEIYFSASPARTTLSCGTCRAEFKNLGELGKHESVCRNQFQSWTKWTRVNFT